MRLVRFRSTRHYRSRGRSPKHLRLRRTPFFESHGETSPDGRWLAYQSDESGETQVHVRPFPDANGGHWQVSASGGTKPVWSHDGKELFYLAGRAMMSVPIQTAPTFSAGNPAKLFEGRYSPGLSSRAYDVSKDGQRFLMIKESSATAEANPSPVNMVVVLNWFEELKRRRECRHAARRVNSTRIASNGNITWFFAVLWSRPASRSA